MSELYSETDKNTNMQIQIMLMNINEFDFKKLAFYHAKRNKIREVW